MENKAEKSEYFRTFEGAFRILVQQEIDEKPIDWHLVETRTIGEPSEMLAHKAAVEQFTGREVEFVIPGAHGRGYVFQVKKEAGK